MKINENIIEVLKFSADFEKITSGRHYWYDVAENMDCDEFYPAFTLYYNGKLNGFGFVYLGEIDDNRFEHISAYEFSVSFIKLKDYLFYISLKNCRNEYIAKF